MRLTGPGNWGEPTDRPQALEILKTAVASGINFIDTADFYGLDVTNRLIAEAPLHPYPQELVIRTKVGGTRLPNKSIRLFARPEHIHEKVIEKTKEHLSTTRLTLND